MQKKRSNRGVQKYPAGTFKCSKCTAKFHLSTNTWPLKIPTQKRNLQRWFFFDMHYWMSSCHLRLAICKTEIRPTGWVDDVVHPWVGVDGARVVAPCAAQVDGSTAGDGRIHKRKTCVHVGLIPLLGCQGSKRFCHWVQVAILHNNFITPKCKLGSEGPGARGHHRQDAQMLINYYKSPLHIKLEDHILTIDKSNWFNNIPSLQVWRAKVNKFMSPYMCLRFVCLKVGSCFFWNDSQVQTQTLNL